MLQKRHDYFRRRFSPHCWCKSREVVVLLFLFLCFLPITGETSSYLIGAVTAGGENTQTNVYNPLSSYGLSPVGSTSSDYTGSNYTSSADVAVYGMDSSFYDVSRVPEGFGIEPMAYAVADVVVTSPYDLSFSNTPTSLASGSIMVSHIVTEVFGAPSSITDLVQSIPLLVSYNLEASGGQYVTTAANFFIQGFGTASGIYYPINSANGESFSGTLNIAAPYNGIDPLSFNIGTVAGVNAYWGFTTDQNGVGMWVGSSGTAVADAFLFIDPTWVYAQYFQVLQESFVNPGEWVEVTRSWQNPPGPDPVPEPSTMLLLGSGLAGLVGYGRRRLKK